MKREPLFNPKKRKILRNTISTWEVLSSVAVIAGLGLIVLWTVAQRDAFDPDDRDVPFEVVAQAQTGVDLYKPPLQPWIEPGEKRERGEPALGFFPGDIVEGEWTIGTRLRQFNSETLFEKINGEADKFLLHGFRSLEAVGLQNAAGREEIDIELFDQADLKGSIGVFSEYVTKGKSPERIGEVFYLPNPAGAIGRKGRFFFRIMGNRASEKIKAKSKQLVEALAGLPENEEEPPVGYRVLLEGMNIEQGQIAYQSANVFQFDFVKDFWFGRLEKDKAARLFLHRSASNETSKELFDQIAVEQGYDYEIKEQTAGHVLMRHSFLKTYFAMKQEGLFVYGVEKALDEKKTDLVLNRFAVVLQEGGWAR